MATSFCRSLLEPILLIGSLLHAVLPKTFRYEYPVPWCRKTYTRVGWYRKHIVKKHTDRCEVESNVGEVLNHVKNDAGAVSPDMGPDDFEDYDNSEKDED